METWLQVIVGIVSLILFIVGIVQIMRGKESPIWLVLFIVGILGLLYAAGINMSDAEIENMIDAIPTAN